MPTPKRTLHFDGENVQVIEQDSSEASYADDFDFVDAWKRSLSLDPQHSLYTDCSNLTPSETAALVRKAKRGDSAARERLITSLLGLTLHFLKSEKRWKRLSEEDTISAVNLAICESIDAAIKSYKQKQAGGFLNYFYRIVVSALSVEADAQQSVVKVPSDTRRELRKHRRALALQQESPFPPKTVERLESIYSGPDKSLEDEVSDSSEPDPFVFIETISNEQSPIPEVEYAKAEGRELICVVFDKHLSERDSTICKMLFGLHPEGEFTINECARALKLPRTTVKGARQAAMVKLRALPDFETLLRILVTPYRPFSSACIPVEPLPGLTKPRVQSKNAALKFDDSVVRRAKLLKEQGMKQKDIATLLEMSEGNLSMVLNRKSRRSVA